MIERTTGNVLTADAEALVNTVNCVGIMGRGVALQFKNSFPANFKAYAEACSLERVQPGRMFVFETGYLSNPRYIINFPTKRHWKGKSRIEDIEAGLADLRAVIESLGIKSIAIPPLGSGLGGLDWRVVRPLIETALADMQDVRILIFEPRTDVPAETVKSREIPAMTAGRAALVSLISRYLNGFLDPVITLLEVHKLMFFMQEAGQPLRLKYAKAPRGPYAENLRHVLRAVEGHLVSGYADGGDRPDKPLALVPGAVPDAELLLSSDTETNKRLERVGELVAGFETPFGLELLSTVYWVSTRDAASDLDRVIEKVRAWGPHKQMFADEQIAFAYEALRKRGWLSVH